MQSQVPVATGHQRLVDARPTHRSTWWRPARLAALENTTRARRRTDPRRESPPGSLPIEASPSSVGPRARQSPHPLGAPVASGRGCAAPSSRRSTNRGPSSTTRCCRACRPRGSASPPIDPHRGRIEAETRNTRLVAGRRRRRRHHHRVGGDGGAEARDRSPTATQSRHVRALDQPDASWRRISGGVLSGRAYCRRERAGAVVEHDPAVAALGLEDWPRRRRSSTC